MKPGLPRRGGAPTERGEGAPTYLLFGQIVPKTCMKMDEIGPRGAIGILVIGAKSTRLVCAIQRSNLNFKKKLDLAQNPMPSKRSKPLPFRDP